MPGRNPNWDHPVSPAADRVRHPLTSSHSHDRTAVELLGSTRWWTGRPPISGQCPGVSRDGKTTSLEQPRLDRVITQTVLDYFDNGWTLTEVLFSSLKTPEAFFRPPYHGLRHPLIFYYVHPAALYLNKLRVAGLIREPLNPYFEQLFETGVDEMSWDDLSKNEMEWPSLPEAHEYRRRAYQIVREVIETHPDLREGHATISASHPLWALFMGFEHERIHLETSSVLIRELAVDLVSRPAAWPDDAPRTTSEVSSGGFERFDGGPVVIGKSATDLTYGWDNEFGRREGVVPAFFASERMVSNREFLEFVVGGGYGEARYWSVEGWRWRSGVNARWPSFWVPRGPAGLNQFDLRALFEVIPFPGAWPVLVNYHEAKAYAAWRTQRDRPAVPYRLLCEAEHHRLRDLAPQSASKGLRFGSEGPVSREAFGNAWHWCEDHFNPLPGFRVHRLYDDFSTPCFDGEHQMILGGSFISTGGEASPSARFHFRPHFFQHAGFRLVRPEAKEKNDGPVVRLKPKSERESSYESEAVLGTYCLLHYGSTAETISFSGAPVSALEFPRRCADLVANWARKLDLPRGRAVDVGCAVGGSTFRLAETFDEVWGIDLSANLIRAAKILKETGTFEYSRRDEGELTTPLVARVTSEISRARARFRQADACALPAEMFDFDAVLAANLICRIPSPRAFISRLGGSRGLVKRGGLLVLTTPFTWHERFSPREVWLGGFESEGAKVFSEDGLRRELSADFDLVDRQELPLLIREHGRKFEYIVPLATVWRRK